MYIYIYIYIVRERGWCIWWNHMKWELLLVQAPFCVMLVSLSLSLYIYIYTSSCYHLKPICGLSQVNTSSLGSDESSWCTMSHRDASWGLIRMNHHDECWWQTMKIHHDASYRFIMMNHHAVSWWRIIANHHDTSWWSYGHTEIDYTLYTQSHITMSLLRLTKPLKNAHRPT